RTTKTGWGRKSYVVEEDKVIVVKENGENILADLVIVSAGAWTPQLLNLFGYELQVEVQRGQIAHIKLPNTDTSEWPVILPQSSHYMLAFDEKIVAGATREEGSGFDYRLTAGGVHEVISEALHVAPGLKQGTLEEMRIGFRPMGPDVLPILGTVDRLQGMVLATGLGASGLTMGPYVGKLAAELAADETSSLDLSPYDPMRAIARHSTII